LVAPEARPRARLALLPVVRRLARPAAQAQPEPQSAARLDRASVARLAQLDSAVRA
jgi:hypothetical protein